MGTCISTLGDSCCKCLLGCPEVRLCQNIFAPLSAGRWGNKSFPSAPHLPAPHQLLTWWWKASTGIAAGESVVVLCGASPAVLWECQQSRPCTSLYKAYLPGLLPLVNLPAFQAEFNYESEKSVEKKRPLQNLFFFLMVLLWKFMLWLPTVLFLTERAGYVKCIFPNGEAICSRNVLNKES